MRSATRSRASVRPNASSSGTHSSAKRLVGGGEHPRKRLRDRHQAPSVHCASLGARQCAGLAAALLDQPDALDAHAAIDRLGHVVDRQAGDRDGGQRLHLDAGLSARLGLGAHDEAGQRVVGRDVDG